MCHWLFCWCSILLCDHWDPAGQSPLYTKKSSNEGQIIETHRVEVHCTWQSPPMRGESCWPSRSKSGVCDKVLWWGANHVGPVGWSSLYMAKFSNEGQIMLAKWVQVRCTWQSPPMRGKSCCPSGSKSIVCDKVLQWGANNVGLVGQSPLFVTKSSNKGHDLRGSHSQWQVISCQIDHDTWHNILCLIHLSRKGYSYFMKCISNLEACLLPQPTSPSPFPSGQILRDHLSRPSTCWITMTSITSSWYHRGP